jgi:tRNA A-37 threonylcarbamoyl transferase component Bud32
MDRNVYAAAAVDDASSEPYSVAESQVRSVREALPDPEDAPGVSEQPAELLSPGTCVAGKYIICDVLGTGGSALVYAAEQVNLKRVVAFKLYPARGALASTMLQRFEREAQLLASVHHENVVAVFDAGRMPNGSPYLVVQRLQGDSLATRLGTAPLSVIEAVDVAHQVLSALCALSDVGIVHRDVKPENLVLDRLPDGRTILKLVDFGIAKAAHDQPARELDEMVGTPGYMAPEQVRGEDIDARCDLYALGATLYEMLTGRTPHTGDSAQQVAMATLFGAIPPLRTLRPDCPEGFAQIVMRALARDPSDRFACAREMKGALDRWRAAQDPGMGAESARERERDEATLRLRTRAAPPLRPHGRTRTRGTVAVACLAALGAFALLRALQVEPPIQEVPRPATTLVLDASALAPDLVQRARDLGSVLMVRTNAAAGELLMEAGTSAWVERTCASAVELLSRVLSSAHELLEKVPSPASRSLAE